MKKGKGKISLSVGIAILCFLFSFPLHAQVKPSKLSAQSLSRQIAKTVAATYLLYLPKQYSTDDNKHYPLLLFLHGSGERGTNVNSLKRVGIPKLIESGGEFDFIVDETYGNAELYEWVLKQRWLEELGIIAGAVKNAMNVNRLAFDFVEHDVAVDKKGPIAFRSDVFIASDSAEPRILFEKF